MDETEYDKLLRLYNEDSETNETGVIRLEAKSSPSVSICLMFINIINHGLLVSKRSFEYVHEQLWEISISTSTYREKILFVPAMFGDLDLTAEIVYEKLDKLHEQLNTEQLTKLDEIESLFTRSLQSLQDQNPARPSIRNFLQ